MTREQLLAANPGIVHLIRDQGETRLANQSSFADAQDVRGSALLTAAVALASAAGAVACGAAAIKGVGLGPVIGACSAAVGFTASAILAVRAMRSTAFHSVGWYPQDFGPDLDNSLTLGEVEADVVLAVQSRSSENRKILDLRGIMLDWSSAVLMATPLVAVVIALVVQKPGPT